MILCILFLFIVQTDGGQSLLVAFVVMEEDESVRPRQQEAISELRKFCAARLHRAMVPTHFHVLDELPLTANHKVRSERRSHKYKLMQNFGIMDTIKMANEVLNLN
jgi:acyl-CoA synthetase (AMP-forming)/AMP-acid ligase II